MNVKMAGLIFIGFYIFNGYGAQPIAVLAVICFQGQGNFRCAVALTDRDEHVVRTRFCGGGNKADDKFTLVLGGRDIFWRTDFQVAHVQGLVAQDRDDAALVIFQGEGREAAGITGSNALVGPGPLHLEPFADFHGFWPGYFYGLEPIAHAEVDFVDYLTVFIE